MYMHAHLRYAQALAHVGEAQRFFHALCQANPIGIRSIVPQRDVCGRPTATTPVPMPPSRIAIRPVRSTSASRAARLRSTAAGVCTRAAPASRWD